MVCGYVPWGSTKIFRVSLKKIVQEQTPAQVISPFYISIYCHADSDSDSAPAVKLSGIFCLAVGTDFKNVSY